MIKNQKQAGGARERLKELLAQQAELESKKASLTPLKYKVAIEALNGFIEELTNEIKEYEYLDKEEICCIPEGDLEDLPHMLIKARIARKMSQEDLAQKLDINAQQIQRYEASDYESASWTRIVEIGLAMDLNIEISEIMIYNARPRFILPNNMNTKEVEAGITQLAKNKSLMSI